MQRILCLFSLAGLCTTALAAQPSDPADAITVKDGKPYAMRGDKVELLADNLNFPSAVTVSTNGTFKVADGNERKLAEGQILRRDGWLVNADGSAEPVFDHVAMKNGQVLILRDGQAQALTKPMTFPNGLQLAPDSSCVYPGGARTRLMDGQLFRLDGTPIPGKDTISLKKGVVVVQRDGTLIPLKPVQLMGMSDGTRAYGDGRIEKQDGTTFRLREGQTILLEGALVRR